MCSYAFESDAQSEISAIYFGCKSHRNFRRHISVRGVKVDVPQTSRSPQDCFYEDRMAILGVLATSLKVGVFVECPTTQEETRHGKAGTLQGPSCDDTQNLARTCRDSRTDPLSGGGVLAKS